MTSAMIAAFKESAVKWTLAVIAAGLVLFALCRFADRTWFTFEPTCNGKSMRQWCAALECGDIQEKAEALDAINSLPFSYGYPSRLPLAVRGIFDRNESELFPAALDTIGMLNGVDKDVLVKRLHQVLKSGTRADKEKMIRIATHSSATSLAAKELLLEAARDEDVTVRVASAMALFCQYGDEVPARSLIENRPHEMTLEAKHAFIDLAYSCAFRGCCQLIADLSADTNADVRLRSIGCIVKLCGAEDRDRLLVLGLRDSAADCRVAAISAIRSIREWNVCFESDFVRLVIDPCEDVRESAIAYVRDFAPRGFKTLHVPYN